MPFTNADFAPDGLFGSRGIKRKDARGAFVPYAQGDADAVLDEFPELRDLGDRAVDTIIGRVFRAPGIMMRRFHVPGGDPFILPEMRPAWAIWTGEQPTTHSHNRMSQYERAAHVGRSKTDADAARKGCTPGEYARFANLRGFDVTGGGDHHGQDTGRRHVHIKIARYLFQENAHKTIKDPDSPHAHMDYKSAEGLWRHEYYEHGGRGNAPWPWVDIVTGKERFPDLSFDERFEKMLDAMTYEAPIPSKTKSGRLVNKPNKAKLPLDLEHPHYITVDATKYAQRLSIHPLSRKRLASAERVFFALEGCLKEAALVSAGEVTFSCPSVSLWDAPELEYFATKHLRGKTIYVVCDSDWERDDDDSVIRQALVARDALRHRYKVDAHVAAPPPGGDNCEHDDKKHGVDDHLGPCGGKGKVDDLIVIEREAPYGLVEWLNDNPPPGRKPPATGIERDAIVLRWIATHAAEDGTTKVALWSVAKNLQEELGSPTLSAANQAVWRAIRKNLIDKYHVVEEVEPLRERVGHHFRSRKSEWVGKLRVTPGLQAQTDLRTIRNRDRLLSTI